MQMQMQANQTVTDDKSKEKVYAAKHMIDIPTPWCLPPQWC